MRSFRHHLLPDWRVLARGTALLLLLGTLCVQQWAVHAHWHADTVVAAAESAEAPDTDPRDGGLPPHDCLLCHVAAHASAAAPPASVFAPLVVDLHVFVGLHSATRVEFSSTPAWAWQSRGPPAA